MSTTTTTAVGISYLLAIIQLCVGLIALAQMGSADQNTWVKLFLAILLPFGAIHVLTHQKIAAAVNAGTVSRNFGYLGHRVWLGSLLLLYVRIHF